MRTNKPKIDNGPVLNAREINVLNMFIDGMSRIKAYRNEFAEVDISDSAIYSWWRRDKVTDYLRTYEAELDTYNVVTDKILLNIITSVEATHRDKIAAIKAWNDLKSRVSVKVESKHSFDFSTLNDSELEKVIGVINGDK